MGKPISVAQKNKLLWWEDLLSHIGKGVDTERGEELGIIQRTTYAELLMYYHTSSSEKTPWSWPYSYPNLLSVKWRLRKSEDLTKVILLVSDQDRVPNGFEV